VNRLTPTFVMYALGIFLVGFAVPAMGQGLDLTAAYQYQHLSCADCAGTNIPGGFSVDIAGRLTPMLKLVAQLDLGHKSETDGSETLTGYEAGVRVTPASSMGFSPFAQVLVGAVHDSFSTDVAGGSGTSSTNFAFDIDGGVAVPLTASKQTSAVVEVGYRRITGDVDANDIRVVLGVRFGFNK